MKWLDNWILKRAKRIRQRNDSIESVKGIEASLRIDRDSDRVSIGSTKHRMNFTVYRANGGMMVEYNRYDDRKDQHYCELHIVHPDQDLGEALGKIITFESLKT